MTAKGIDTAPIIFTEDIQSMLKNWVKDNSYHQVAVLVDENTKTHCYPQIDASLPSHRTILIRSGEINKNLNTCEHIWAELTTYGFDRKSLLINLGGGVIGDMGGFCAATFKRGMDFINIPTTLLAQVDASIGGKLGIDFHSYKNHIGLFKDPKVVFIDPAFLNTLTKREKLSGFAEIIKHTIISDKKSWKELSQNQYPDYDWPALVQNSIALKKSIVEEDPYESGKRKILNFGHTAGHAIESLRMGTNSALLHGEAVAIGMMVETQIAYKKGYIKKYERDEILKYVCSVYGKISIGKENYNDMLSRMQQDKKNKNKEIYMALPNSIGDAQWDIQVSPREILESLDFYETY